jgi:hypothetical protein
VLSTFRATPHNSLKNTLQALVEQFITHVNQGNRFILVQHVDLNWVCFWGALAEAVCSSLRILLV